MTKEELNKQALIYHSSPVKGKVALKLTKPCNTQDDLSLAYTPGVAAPCMEIHDKPETVYDYTNKGNTVAVVSDGTAVLGLGNIGPEAGMPVMEGKAVLFKKFADIDAVALCLGKVYQDDGRTDADKLIAAAETLEPSFGGINLEDIAAPACFKVETELKKRMTIPVFHDDQHGTAIISMAALLNSARLTGRKLEEMKVVVNGAGAAGCSCAEFYITAGIKRENLVICNSKGVIYKGSPRPMTEIQARLATSRECRTLAEAMVGADMLLGCSVANCVTKEMVASMAPNPIVLAMANPTPEIAPQDALDAGAFVVGTGRTDYPNQVNNVLGFPGIFRGALDCRATDINEEMMLAASYALAEIALMEVPADIKRKLSEAYPKDAAAGMFDGPCPLKATYVIPKPFDPRVVPHVARRVVEAAIQSGVAMIQIPDMDAYEKAVAARLNR